MEKLSGLQILIIHTVGIVNPNNRHDTLYVWIRLYISDGTGEIAGGSHAVNSGHYDGIAIDVNLVDGIKVIYMTTDQINAFRNAAFSTGATEVFDPKHDPDGHHNNHIHIQW